MFKLILSFVFIFIFSCNLQAQNCNCAENLKWVKKIIEENDAGFQYVLDQKGLDAYQAHNTKIEQKLAGVKSNLDCTKLLSEWLQFIRKGHLSINRIDGKDVDVLVSKDDHSVKIAHPSIPFSEEEFKLYLSAKKRQDLEGIWDSPPYKVAIKKYPEGYKGIIVGSTADNWVVGDVKFTLNNELSEGTYYLRDKSQEKISSTLAIGKNIFQLGNYLYTRKYPTVENTPLEADFARSYSTDKPYLQKINTKTILLRIPSFNGRQKQTIDSLTAVHKPQLEKTENLIIDIRNNGGGSDGSYAEIIPFLYTNPIRTVGVTFYSTKLNNQRMLDFCEKYEEYGIDPKDVPFYKAAYDSLSNHLGKFVNLRPNRTMINIDSSHTALPYPKQVAIIINGGNGSTAEQFLLEAKQSKKVKLFGTTTAGVLDISNMYFVESPCKEYRLGYSLSKSYRIPEMAIDNKGIQPDFYIDKSIPAHEWVDHVRKVLEDSK
ncbi:S41 family peptidase [Sphingobacterium sp. GVS05A]|uniref:S41 family peptidase n=1 Tax=Sphingobacterium sp. GVS05A TaxID=2862679 RepID=UPI001CBD8EC1|nr:S41 family peptidase [Sphingobacterium sp. GVS05A]